MKPERIEEIARHIQRYDWDSQLWVSTLAEHGDELIAALREALAENERLSQRTYRGWYAAVISNPDGDKINNVYWSRVDAQRRVGSWLPGTGRVVDCCVVLAEGDPR